jgi:hypothetical protein
MDQFRMRCFFFLITMQCLRLRQRSLVYQQVQQLEKISKLGAQ